ncbi:SMP-30/gluconolactonase/LRE family protein [Prauserella muralis]|uniref:Uncharacterized protein n=1 Tax=Prauserella muralis TaxID=588067 RepID=A0A2V4AIY5_9PSEU|nr:SMP-30/gluconolactonase/LRE family protein [Prauserella muralis]PXY19550.1 hypothetical protein BAY60_33010 [Prauserella muralis]TWE29541.1 sugar lactone lactonase YvrE [Prauserella muralis]
MGTASSPDVVVEAVAVSGIVAALGESPLWQEGVGLRWLDVTGRWLHTRGLDGVERSVALSGRVTAVEAGPGAELFAVTGSGFGWVDPDSGAVTPLATVLGEASVSMNDGAIDARGRCWAGSAVRDGSGRGALFRFDGREVTAHVTGVGMSNGIGFSPGGEVLYHVDSAAGTVTAWEYDLATGELGRSRLLRTVPAEIGLPDGLAIDTGGGIWLAVWGPGQVWRLDPGTGAITALVEVPTPCTTSCVFGGPGLGTLYITTADHESPPGGGLLYAAEVPARGLAAHPFTEVTR